MKIIKKEWVVAVVLLLLIPVVLVLGGALFSLINPEIAAGHPNYVRNFHLLTLLKLSVIYATAAVVVLLWVLVCLQVIRAKKRPAWWLVLAVLGPFGLAILAMLNDRTTAETDRYSGFVRNMNWFVRAGYELCTFVIVWELAYQGMALKRALTVRYEAARTGMSVAQVIDVQNASGGMWAFAEGMEVMFFVVLLYLLRPVVFNLVGRVAAIKVSSKAS
jgi:glucan phosphoethanolaminetransferase (alkaline phosphatase superfamily)